MTEPHESEDAVEPGEAEAPVNAEAIKEHGLPATTPHAIKEHGLPNSN